MGQLKPFLSSATDITDSPANRKQDGTILSSNFNIAERNIKSPLPSEEQIGQGAPMPLDESAFHKGITEYRTSFGAAQTGASQIEHR
jgi:hypothetical protein